MLSVRKNVQLISWPDPLLQERLEDMGFFFDNEYRTWIRFCDADEMENLAEWLKRHGLSVRINEARGRGETRRLPKLSESLAVKSGGSPQQCGLCGTRNVSCRLWIEGDDTDSTDYPNAAKFYLCGPCVQTRMQSHPRLYAPADDEL